MTESFEAHRPQLFSLAYRMLGSASEAEDVVQDAWLRYQAAPRQDVRSPRAFLATIATRLCLDRLKSARAARETYVGPWLPEPVLTEPGLTPEDLVQRRESITLAFLNLLETLTPEERAVYLLREVFDYGYDEIADVLQTSAANCRQLFHRAKQRVADGRPRFAPSDEARRRLVERFMTALDRADVPALERLLAEDVRFWGDGGGKAAAARRPLAGRAEVLNLFAGIARLGATVRATQQVDLAVAEVNAEPAVVLCLDGRIDAIFVCTVEDDAIAAIRAIRNPDKLVAIARQFQRTGGS